jgi:hypothetical protein
MNSYTDLVQQKLSELQVAEMSVVKEAPPTPVPAPAQTGAIPGAGTPTPTPIPKTPKRLSLNISPKTTVGDFKKMFQIQLQQLAGMQDSDEIEIDLK